MRFFKILTATAMLIPLLLNAEKITINFNDTPIRDVIQFVAKQTNNNILVTDKISGKVNFISQTPIEKKDLIPLLTQILQNKGYTVQTPKSSPHRPAKRRKPEWLRRSFPSTI